MYRKNFFITLAILIAVSLFWTGLQQLNTVYGFSHQPSAYDPQITVEQAVKTSKVPLLIEFYSDSCGTCRTVSPWMSAASKKFEDKLTFVMVDVNDKRQAFLMQLFNISVIPTVYLFDFRNMQKQEVSADTFYSQQGIETGIADALTVLNKRVALRRSRVTS